MINDDVHKSPDNIKWIIEEKRTRGKFVMNWPEVQKKAVKVGGRRGTEVKEI